MYEEFFGLTEKPFSIQPDPSFLYWGRGHRLAYAMLEYGVLNHAGISVITGEVGCGKTTLIHRLLDQLSGTHSVALLSNIQAGRGDLLSWVLMGFGQPFAGKSHVELFEQLQQFFISEYAQGRRVILIIDEAQNLSIDMLEELRMLSNINAGKDQLLQLILAGQPQLKDLLNRPDMLQLAQRIGSDFHLTPLSREEVDAYIDTRLSIAGARRRIFSEDAIDLIAEQSKGVPRVINVIADTALVYAFSAQQPTVDGEIVRNVIRDKYEFGVFGIAARGEQPAAPQHDGPTAFVRPEKAERSSERREPNLRIASSSRRDGEDEPRMPSPRRISRVEPEPAAEKRVSAVSRRETAALRAQIEPAAELFSAPSRAEPEDVELEPEEAAPAYEPSFAEFPEEDIAPQMEEPVVGIVVAGAGELDATINSAGDECRIIYVAKTGDEGAASAARQAGVDVLEIADRALTPGRARNAGYRELKKQAPDLKYVQFIEAGFVLDPRWVETATRFMERRPEVAVIEGSVSESSAKSKEQNAAAARGVWGEPGEAQITGSSAFVRAAAFESAGGFRGDLIVNETADLCIRLRRRGSHVWRVEDPMGARIVPTGKSEGWWSRAVRRGFEYAHGADLHGAPPELLFARENSRAIFWGAIFPALIVIGAGAAVALTIMFAPLVNPLLGIAGVFGLAALISALKIVGRAVSFGAGRPSAWSTAMSEHFGHLPEFIGVWRFHFGGARMKAPARGAN
ncbi:MAG: AAA family ATPase [Parvularculaceae bacterium]